MNDLKEMARVLRREARRHTYFQGAQRYLDGYKLILSYASAEEMAKINKTAEQAAKNVFPEERLREHVEVPLPGVEHWHFSTSWRRGSGPPEAAQKLLQDLVEALGIPEDSRVGIAPIVVANSPQVTHWFWTEKVKA